MSYIKHYKNLSIQYAPNGVAIVTASKRDGFGRYCVNINNGILTIFLHENMLCAASSFIFKVL